MAEPTLCACLICGSPVGEPEDLAPAKPWWPPMVKCQNEECIAFGIHVAADPDQLERDCFADPDRIEPKFAHSGTDDWFVSTIYRRSSAPYGGWYYETHGYRLRDDGGRDWLYDFAVSYPRKALRAHSVLTKRLNRSLAVLAEGRTE